MQVKREFSEVDDDSGDENPVPTKKQNADPYKCYDPSHSEKPIPNQDPLLPQAPFNMQIAGTTNTGKTAWLLNFLLNPRQPFKVIHYFYRVWQKKFEDLRRGFKGDVVFHHGLQDKLDGLMEELKNNDKENRYTLIVFDDLMDQIERRDNSWVTALTTAGCHHMRLSVCFLTQKIFSNKTMRTQCANGYIVLMNFLTDKDNVQILGRQIMPEDPTRFMRMHQEATAKEDGHGWLMIDFKCNLTKCERFPVSKIPTLMYRDSSFTRCFSFE